MKALSIKEPWAGLIISGKKTIEVRTWRTNYRGPILIHRSGKNGGIIGMAEIVDIIEFGSLNHYKSLRDKHHASDDFYQEKLFGWVLKNIRKTDYIPCKGKLRFWVPPDNVILEIKKTLKFD